MLRSALCAVHIHLSVAEYTTYDKYTVYIQQIY